MTPVPLRVLLVHHAPDGAARILGQLDRGGYLVTSLRVDCAEAFATALDRECWDVVISAYQLPSFGARAAIRLLQARAIDIPFFVISRTAGEQHAVDAMRAGAHDYLMEDNLARLVPAITRELGDAATRRKHRRAEGEIYRLNVELKERVRQRTVELKTVMDAVPATIFLAYDPECRWMTGNRSAYDLLRMSYGSNLSFSAAEGERPRHFHAMRNGRVLSAAELPMRLAAARGVEIRDCEFDIVFDDGQRRRIFGNAAPLLDTAGRSWGAVAAFVDITERVEAECALLRLNTTLEERVAERTAEAERRALQLQTLATELLHAEEHERRRLAQVLHDHLQQLLYAAKLSIFRLRRRTEDVPLRQALADVDGLLNESVQASRELTADLSPPVLYERGLIAALEWLVDWMQEKHGLYVEFHADAETEPAAEESRVLLFRAVRELLFNTVKHAQANRAIVSLTRMPQARIEIVVADNGVGFDPAGLERVRVQGNSFGLFSLRERLEMLGGRLVAESSPGQGTRMTVIVPDQGSSRDGQVAEATAARPPAQTRRARSGARIRVLVADDHEILREGLAILLREEPDMEIVAEAVDGQAAVELALETVPDVVVMDVSMPRKDGIEATREITTRLPRIRVIGLSMHADQDTATAMRAAGAIDYLAKGVSSHVLLAAIRRHAPRDLPAPRS